MAIFGRRARNAEEVNEPTPRNSGSTLMDGTPEKALVKKATRTRMIWCGISAFFLLLSVIFMILVEIGNTSKNGALKDYYFIKLNVANVFPSSIPNAGLLNSIAQTIGLHDFYQVGLWNYCEGYDNSRGVTDCSKPQTLYWFNPVAIISSELIAGASSESRPLHMHPAHSNSAIVTLPSDVTSILGIIETASQWMFGLFLSGACLAFVMMFVVFLSVFSRWTAFIVMIFTFLAALLIIAASVIATVMFTIMKNAFTNSITEVNIGATIGTEMFAFMWIASAAALIAFIIQLCLCCCCVSRRDVKRGNKKGVKAYQKVAEKNMV